MGEGKRNFNFMKSTPIIIGLIVGVIIISAVTYFLFVSNFFRPTINTSTESPSLSKSETEKVLWGPIEEFIQLSLVAEPTSLTLPGELKLRMRIRNLIDDSMTIDAAVRNQSTLIFVDPNGQRYERPAWDNMESPLIILRGETDLGWYMETILGIDQYTSQWFPEFRSLKGTYRISWQLAGKYSNIVQVKVR